MAAKQPIQPLYWETRNLNERKPHLRFQENTIVRDLVDFARNHGFGLGVIATRVEKGRYSLEAYNQLIHLIGYSVSGAEELIGFDKSIIDRAMKAFVAAGGDPNTPPKEDA